MFTDLLVKLDNSTRWNSTYESLKRALTLKARIQQYFFDNERELKDDRLSEEDWQFLQQVCDALIIFEQATRRLEGNAKYGSWGGAWEVLPVMEALQRKLVEGQRKWQPEMQPLATRATPTGNRRRPQVAPSSTGTIHPMTASYQSAWEKHQKWYSATDDAQEIYAAAVLLHPSYRAAYYKKHWTGELEAWIQPTIDRVKIKHKNNYQHLDEHNTEDTQSESQPSRKRPRREPDFIDDFLNEDLNSDAVLQDPFDCYIYGSPMGNFSKKEDLLSWWRDSKLPKSIQRQALDLLSIPAMSAEMERVFSSAKRLITQDRNRLTPDMIEVLVLLKYWLDHGVIAPAGVPSEEEEQQEEEE